MNKLNLASAMLEANIAVVIEGLAKREVIELLIGLALLVLLAGSWALSEHFSPKRDQVADGRLPGGEGE